MKWAANLSLLYTEHPFIERFSAAAADGFDAVEIQFPYDTPVSDIRAALDRNGQTCVLINVPAGDLMQGGEGLASVPGKQGAFADALQQCAEYVRILRPSRVNVLAGRCTDKSRYDEYRNVFLNNLRLADEVLSPLGVTVTFEAINTVDMPDFLISTCADMASVIEDLAGLPVKMQFDIYHMAMMQQDVTELLRGNIDQIGHVQFADAPGRNEPGKGALDFASVFAAISETGYAGWVAAEYRPSDASTSRTLGWKSE